MDETTRKQKALVAAIQAAESAAQQCGLMVAARALNRAKNAAGWEMAGDLDRAAEALEGM